MIEEHFGDGQSLGMQIEYAYEREPLGTGGALKNALELLEDEFILMNGDSFLPLELDDLAGDFDAGRYEAMVAAYDNAVPTPVKNNLLVKNGTVWEYKREAGVEGGFGHVDAGVYCLKKSVIANFQGGVKFQLEDVWKPLIVARQLGAFVVRDRFYDIGTPERLAEFEAYVRAESARGRFTGREPEGRP
jgi:NDP-sugar pyrophosphorylase family protein